MALSIEDLKPKKFQVTLGEHKFECLPPRLEHTMLLSKVGKAFQEIDILSREKLKEVQSDFDYVVGELIEDLRDVQLGTAESISVLEQIMQEAFPDETNKLAESGVSFGDPKAKTKKVG